MIKSGTLDLIKLNGILGYRYEIGSNACFHPDGSISAASNIEDDARQLAVEEGEGTREEVDTWVARYSPATPVIETGGNDWQ